MSSLLHWCRNQDGLDGIGRHQGDDQMIRTWNDAMDTIDHESNITPFHFSLQ